jgi:predicted metal-dependent hydrolase
MPEAVQQITFHIQEEQIQCTIKRSKKRRRTLSMQLHSREGIIVQVPWRATKSEVQNFIDDNHKWLLKQAQQLKSVPSLRFNSGEKLSYLGESCYLTIIESNSRSRCEYQDNEFKVTIKPELTEKQRQEKIYELIKKWFYQKAHAFLSFRLAFWQEKLKLDYNQLKITNPRQRWGCCDTNNNIRINWRIMLTPLDLIDYLLVHELCHVPHKNHSRTYWQLVASVLPDYRERRQRLREHPASFF